jgi:hypothetical protein
VSAAQLSFWDDAPPIEEPAEPLTWCPGIIEQDGQTLYYAGGLSEGTPRYEPRPDLDAIAGLPIDLKESGWKRHTINPVWLTHQRNPGDTWITTTGATLEETIAKARQFNELFAAADARRAEQVEKPKRKKTAA